MTEGEGLGVTHSEGVAMAVFGFGSLPIPVKGNGLRLYLTKGGWLATIVVV